MERHRFQSLGILVMILLLAVSPNALCKQPDNATSQPIIIQEKSSASQPQTKTQLNELRYAITTIAKNNIPAVVHIEVTQNKEVVNPFALNSPLEGNPLFRQFFNMPEQPKKFRQKMKGLGTGMIIKSDGYILTNYHVVGNASEIKVTLSNDTQYNAKIIGTDPKTDLAVIKIATKEKLPTVTFGDSDNLEVGEWVVAIGHPRGLDQTVTQGIISAKHRHGITNPNNYQDFLQTDAAINPGNSGGPLLNLEGQVVGVNAVIATQSGGSEGIGFAIPTNMAVYIVNKLITQGSVDRGWLGLTVQDITFDKMKSLHLDKPKGALVLEVSKNGPSELAGLKAGDVILSLDDKTVENSGELRNLAANKPIGAITKVGILRDGKKLTIPVKIGNLNDVEKIIGSSLWKTLGAEVIPVSDNETEQYGLSDGQGVVITKLDPKGPLAQAGVEVSDLILQINNIPINSMGDISEIAASLKSGQDTSIYLIDHRSGQAGTIRIQVN